MNITFHGAARSVTGSKHLIELANGKKILLDCGMFQGMGKETDQLNRNFGFNPAEINYLILSHAHIDHSGLIPKLVKEGFAGKIFCTPATNQLAAILMEDSADIQASDTKFINKRRAKKNLPPFEPLYDIDDVTNAIQLFQSVPYNQWFVIEKNIEVLFTDAGHIIGSAAVHLRIQENGKTTQITFSGDVGRYRDVILKSPQPFPQADHIIIESTYGNKQHDKIHGSIETLLEWIKKTCIQKKGKLIIPAFSVGRTQEILYYLNQMSLENTLPKVPVYVDSPLSREATELVKSYPQYFNKRVQKILEIDEDPFHFPGLQYIKSVDESKALNFQDQPCIILSASGMADAGRVKHHIMNNIAASKNTILMVGYCEPNSLGGILIKGAKEVKIFGEMYPVKAEIGIMKTMSAHGDYDDLSQFLACQNPALVQNLFLVHGEYAEQEAFKTKLLKKGFKAVHIPERHQTFHLD